ncbi:MAG: Flp pilus assembly protein CpaB [Candidatus Omnitrophica bacterium]|jgi:pilus assembly protein CpaB|nr:Flp pilus assembly protein CpaB [Candidatus Omnitrophota bacterium]
MALQKQQIYLIVGGVFAVGAIFATLTYINQEKQKAQELARAKFNELRKEQVSVLVAARDIPKGKAIEAGDFTAKIELSRNIQSGAVTSADRLAGMVAIADIDKGDQILMSKLSYSRQESSDLSAITPAGKRAITISVDNIAAVAGMLKSGDKVDVIAMIPQAMQGADGKVVTQLISLPIFQNIEVLAVGQKLRSSESNVISIRAKREVAQDQAPLITLALDAQQANLIAFVQEQGKIKLSLRAPGDNKIEPVQPATWDAVLQYVFPQAPVQQEVHKPSDYVEIYRGTNKEKVLLEK